MAKRRTKCMRKGDYYGTLVIRIPIVASRSVPDIEEAFHEEENYMEHAAKSVMNYAKSRNAGDCFELQDGTYSVE